MSRKIIFTIIKYHLIDLKKKRLYNKIIDLIIRASLSLFVTGIVLPNMGLTSNFINLQFATLMASIGLFESYTEIFLLADDMNNKKFINFEFSYPMSSFLLFVVKILCYTIKFIIYSIIVGFLCKIIFFNYISLSKIMIFKTILSIILANIFYGSFIIFVYSFVKNIMQMGHVWSRFIFPLWFMGGFQFSWYALWQVNKYIAYCNLFNPILYISEIFKHALFNNQDPFFFSFYSNVYILLLFTIVFFLIGYKRLQKKLEFL